MHLSLKGKTAVVTGAAGGMGLATISLLLKYNIHILALDIQKPNNKIFNNKKITYHEINLVDQTKLNEIIKNFVKKHKRIDYLVNTTGVLWFGKDVSAVDLDLEIWDSVFNINLKTMVLLSKAIIPVMKKNKFGSMVHISSVDALSGDDKPQDAYGASKAAMIRLSKSLAIQFALSGDDKPQDAYGASKAAMIRLSKSLAIQFGLYNIRSNCILPGAVETPMQNRWKKIPNAKKNLKEFMPMKKIIQPKGVAEGILFLLSDQSEFITGTELVIDGGLTARP